MKKVMLVILLSFMVQMFSATYTVDGHAYLEGETDHSGIEVFFQRVAPDSLFSYSAYTDTIGYFNQVVEDGWYDISYSKTGYISQDTTDVALYSDQTLNIKTLQKEEQGLSGNISGVLSRGEYSVADSLFVPEGDSLLIEPGVVLNFNTETAFIVNGKLIAEGIENDSIYFVASTDSWKGIRLNYRSSGSSIKFCHINNTAGSAVWIGIKYDITEEYIALISDTFIKTVGNGLGIDGWGDYGGDIINLNLKNVTIAGNGQYAGIYSVGPICLELDLQSCSIINFTYGIHSEMHHGFESNYNINNTLINSVKGIVHEETNLLIYNSTLVVKDVGISDYTDSRNTEVYNCLIYCTEQSSNNYGIADPDAVVYNTNVYGFETNFYCGPYIGTMVTTNANGDPCDAYQNISMDPRFTTGFKLLSDSPCIDAGTNTISGYTFPTADLAGNYRIWDGNGDSNAIVDMGAYEYGAPQVMLSPQNITGNMSGSDFVLSWNEVSGASSYTVYSSTDPYASFPGGWTVEASGIIGTDWTDMNVTGTKMFYVVVAVSGDK